MEEESNFFDEVGSVDPEEVKRYKEEVKVKGEKLDYLIHRTFTTESGAELLSKWIESLIMDATAQPGMDQIQIGMNEGTKQFIRYIMLTVNKVEKSE